LLMDLEAPMIRYKVIRPVLAVGIALILFAILTSHGYRELAETNLIPRHRTFENIDQDCLRVDADRGDRLGPASFSVFPEPNKGLLIENLYLLPDIPSFCQKSLVLRC